jgi:glycosyltransferase involved in cell wall biosynthesis
MKESNITVIIPMRNEIKHIKRSVESALKLTPNVFVVDSSSTDGSIEEASRLGAQVFQYEWTAASNFSTKINWALNNLPIKTKWAIRLDADEYFMDNCIQNLQQELDAVPDDVNGITLIRRIFFLGRWMKHSAEYPKTSMRIFRVGHVEMESRWLDEHVDVKDGRAISFPYDIVDDSRISISEWINKHNVYSTKEAIELIHQEIGLFNREEMKLDKKAQKKKNLKAKYASWPKYWRCFIWFFYREFVKLGFLDGKEGFLWNFFQGFWYRVLADVKVDEIYKACGKDKDAIRMYVFEHYGLKI